MPARFSIATIPRGCGWRYSFTLIAPLTLDPCLIMLSDKQGGIKCHIFSLWRDWIWKCPRSLWPLANSKHYTISSVSTISYEQGSTQCHLISGV